MPTKVFWIEPTDRCDLTLRVYESRPCVGGGKDYCDTGFVLIEPRAMLNDWSDAREAPESPGHFFHRTRSELIAQGDHRWPTVCPKCQVPFTENANHQVWADELYSGALDGNLYSIRNAPPGAMWDAWWMGEWYRGTDGICLMVRLPNGSDWFVDQEASNCTRPQVEIRDGETYRTERTHFCWCRHGDPRTGMVTVDKNCDSCNAGGGSIQSGDYHGFLQNGVLTP